MNGDRLAACGLGLLTIWRTDDFSVVNTMNLKNKCLGCKKRIRNSKKNF